MTLYRFDVFELDSRLYRLFRAGEPVAIGPKPFDLLLHLVQNCQRTITKAELIREVWQAQAVSDSSIPTCITAVRRALGDDPENPKFIQTVRGRGYRFIANVAAHGKIEIDSNRQHPADSKANTFVGRSAEMTSLSVGLEQSVIGDPQTFLLAGEAGMGKTRIIEEFAHLAKAQKVSVLVGRCREEEGAPDFWPWIQILRTHIESNHEEALTSIEPYAAIISQMLPEFRMAFPTLAPLPDVDAAQARFRLFDAITMFLRSASKQQPLALMIDDLHRADTSSLLLFEFIVRELRDAAIFILGTYRDLDILGDTTREQCLTRVARSATCRAIQLNGISRSAVAELVGQPENGELVAALYEQSNGNPLFLTQLVQLLNVHSNDLSSRSVGEWRFSLPTGVRDAIALQLAGLSPETRNVLTLAAVIGRDFSVALLARTLKLPFSEVLEYLEPVVAMRLIEDAQHNSRGFRFSHALLRDVIYDQIPKVDRAQLHRRIGRAIEALHEPELDNCIAELAFHFAESAMIGEAGKAIAYSIAAGQQAASRLAHENSTEYLRDALRLIDFQDAPDPRKRCEILIQLGAAEMRIGEREMARRHLIHAAGIARNIDAPELFARAALGLAPGFFTIEVGTCDPELEALLNEARTALPRMQCDLLVQVTARLAMAAVWSNSIDSCDELSEAALALANDLQNPITKAYALRARHGALWGPQRFDERQKLISELGTLAGASGDAEINLMYRILNITALLEAGDIFRVDREISEYTALADSLQLPHARWYVSLYCAMRSLLEGRFSDAETEANQFLELGNRVHDSNASQSFGAHLILRLWEFNKLDAISAILSRFIKEHPTMLAWKCTASFFLSESNDVEGARIFRTFAEIGFENIPRDETWAIALQMLANTCCAIEDSISAERIYYLSLPGRLHYTIVGYGVMSWGSRARELGNLASLMGCFDDAEEHFELAVSQNRRTGAAPWVARSQYDYARMLIQQRNHSNAERIRELMTDAQQIAQRLGMVRLQLQIAELARQF